MRRDPLALFARAAREGDVVRLRLGRDVYLLNHPDHVQRVLHENHANYRKSFFYARLRPLVGDGLLTSEGAAWRRKRRLAQPAFHRDRLASFAEIMAEHTAAMLEAWAPRAARGEPVDVSAEMMRLTLTVVGHALFGHDLLGTAADVSRAFTEAMRLTNENLYSLVYLPPSVPTPRNVRFSRAMRVLDRVVRSVIEARRAAPPRPDLLGMLMEARDEEGGPGLDDGELRDSILTMVLAGHETTANALAWAFHLLSQAPAVARRLHEEASAALGDGRATLAALPRLGFAAQVCQEAMRLYPPAWVFGREAIEDDVFGGFRIPAGAAVSMAPWLLHRDPRWWRDPKVFDPGRFEPDAAAARHRYCYVPFAAGPRMCIGNAFATMEMQVVLGMIAARYRLELVPGRPVVVEPSVTLRPRSGVWMTLHDASSVRPDARTAGCSSGAA
jgi:cytochrome P450